MQPIETPSRMTSGSPPDVIGLAEVAEWLGLSRQRASEVVRGEGFPVGRWLAAGPVWRRQDIAAWAGKRVHKPTRKRGSATPAGLTGKAPSTPDRPGPGEELPPLWADDLETYAALSALEEDGPALARLYLEAHDLLAGRAPTDPLALVAHDVRDLVMQLHRSAATPGEASIDVSKTAYYELRDAWEAAREKLVTLGADNGVLDDASRRFLHAAEQLLGVQGALKPSKARRQDRSLAARDPVRHLIPESEIRAISSKWNDERKYFNEVGHHSRPTTSEEMRHHIRALNRLILSEIRPRPFDVIDSLNDAIAAAEGQPSVGAINAALDLITLGHGVEFDYFFRRIRSPIWIEEIRARKWFDNPPEPVVTGTTTSYAMWIPGEYLARVASVAPDQVVDICVSIAGSTNPRVRHAVLLAMLEVPTHKAKPFLKAAIKWAGDLHTLVLVARDLGEFARRLAMGGAHSGALGIMRQLLALEAVEPTAVEIEGTTIPIRHDPRPRYEPYEYRQIVSTALPDIVRACGLEAFVALSRLLDSAIHSRSVDLKRPRDFSIMWRPSIEASEENLDIDALDALIDAVRDAGVAVVSQEPSCTVAVAEELRRRRWDCHQRILVHVARCQAAADHTLAIDLLMQRSLLFDYALNHERDLLARECFRHLDKSQQRTFLEWIEAGPDRDEVRKRHSRVPSNLDVDTYIDQSIRAWQGDRLAPLAEHLPAVWRARLADLIEQHGEPELSRPRYIARIGAKSPVTSQELEPWSAEQIAEYAASWKPSHQVIGPSPEGLATAIQAAVKRDPVKFADAAGTFRRVPSPYLRAVIAGLREAAAEGGSFAWHEVLMLIEHAVDHAGEQPAESSEEVVTSGDESWTRQEAARLLEAGLTRDTAGLPVDELESAVWLVKRLLHDPNPTPSEEAQLLSGPMDPLTTGINSVRGQAVQTAVHLMHWVGWVGDATQLTRVRGEMFDELERLLDIANEPSVGVRAVIGLVIPQLIANDEHWVSQNRARIFPSAPSLRNIRDATWEAYLGHSRVYVDVFRVLRDQYEDLVDDLPASSSEPRDARAAGTSGQLGVHLVSLYMFGELDLADGGIIDRYFRAAPLKAREYVLSTLGRSLRRAKDGFDDEQLERVRALWDRRIGFARDKGGDALEELRSFSWTFSSGLLDAEWALDQLNRILATGVHLEGEHLIAERLLELAGTYEAEVLRALQRMVRHTDDSWDGVAGWIELARAILEVLGKSSDQSIAMASDRLVNELGVRGFAQTLRPLRSPEP